MSAAESSDSHSVEPGSLDRTGDVVLLFYRRNSIVVTGADVNWRAQKIRARLDPGVSIAQVVLVCTGHVDTNDATAILREQRRNVTNTFSSSRKPSTRDWPLYRSGEAAVKCVNGSERHCSAPRGGIVSRRLRSVARKQHPTFTEAGRAVKLNEIISILTFEIARGTGYQHGPALSRVEIYRCRQYGHGVRRRNISSLSRQRFFLCAQWSIGLDRRTRGKSDSCKLQWAFGACDRPSMEY